MELCRKYEEIILKQISVDKNIVTLVDIGCGYGTFLLLASELISGNAIGIDIDEKMVEAFKNKIQDNNISNAHVIHGDISKGETARGSSMEVRPKPETIIEWASKAGFTLKSQIDIPPYHFDLVFTNK
ncbi:methyltransferase domain-containing protein [Clostridium bovifaecis]|uniref:Methyltransferase domain-containing protein n=1 Tax=Clostridium bovifaecis TaxID=2184719 RepID=A0A6I6FDM9_9CLOT|nr:methyltransferase domain-containing protein [Clostridium bovifaecis]